MKLHIELKGPIAPYLGLQQGHIFQMIEVLQHQFEQVLQYHWYLLLDKDRKSVV